MEPKAGFGVVDRAQVQMSKEMSLADLVRTSAWPVMRARMCLSMLSVIEGSFTSADRLRGELERVCQL